MRAWGSDTEESAPLIDNLPIWRECFAAVEAVLLHLAPIYYGFGAPHGDQAGVVLIPGFLGSDVMMAEMYAWLYRMDYRPYFSGMGLNADCPNLLINNSLNETLDRARRESGKKVHIVGHSLGGMLAMSLAAQRPDDVASVISLGAPFRGKAAHPNVLRAAEYVRKIIQARHGDGVLPTCYTSCCQCNFVDALNRTLPDSVMMTAIYSRTDALVDWNYCITGDCTMDFEAPGTHLGMVFNPSVYQIVADRLHAALQREDPAAAPVED